MVGLFEHLQRAGTEEIKEGRSIPVSYKGSANRPQLLLDTLKA